MDNVFQERLWRSQKQTAFYVIKVAVHLHALSDWIDSFNDKRPHTALGRRSPDVSYGDRVMGK